MSQKALSAAVMPGMIVLALLLFSCGQQRSTVEEQPQASERSQPAASRPEPPAGVENIDVGPAGYHVVGNVDYEQDLGTPPAGGPHNDVWQNCGFYDEPVRDENAVHSLEHGAVWITYLPDLPQDQVDKLKEIAQGQTYILASPYPGLDFPVVATAWGKQVSLDGADDPGLESFIKAYRLGPQTPEPGAICTSGTSGTSGTSATQ